MAGETLVVLAAAVATIVHYLIVPPIRSIIGVCRQKKNLQKEERNRLAEKQSKLEQAHNDHLSRIIWIDERHLQSNAQGHRRHFISFMPEFQKFFDNDKQKAAKCIELLQFYIEEGPYEGLFHNTIVVKCQDKEYMRRFREDPESIIKAEVKETNEQISAPILKMLQDK